MKEIGAIFVVWISEIRTVQLAAIKRRYNINIRGVMDEKLLVLHVKIVGMTEPES